MKKKILKTVLNLKEIRMKKVTRRTNLMRTR